MSRKARASSLLRTGRRPLGWISTSARRGGQRVFDGVDRLGARAGREVGEEVEQVAVDDVRLLRLHPVPAEGAVLELERARDERLHPERQLAAERDVVLAPDDEGRRRDLRPVLGLVAPALERAVAEEEAPQPARVGAAEVG